MAETKAGKPVELTAAEQRMRLAVEQTLLAWFRTGLALMGFGFVVARFALFLSELAAANPHITQRSSSTSLWIGTALLLLGVLTELAAIFEYRRFIKGLRRGVMEPGYRDSLAIAIGLITATLGMMMAIHLLQISM